MSDELQTEEDAPVSDPVVEPVVAEDPPAAKPKAKAPRKPRAKKAPAAPKAAKGATAKIKFVGPPMQTNGTLAQHGYRALCEEGKVYELPADVAARIVKSSRHFQPAK